MPSTSSSPRVFPLFAALLAGFVGLAGTAQAQLYWDGNGGTAGAGTIPAGTWGVDAFWSTDAAGGLATGPWVPGSEAVFSAGTDAAGSFTVTLGSSQSAGNLTFQEGFVTLGGITPATNLTFGGPVSVAAGATGAVNVTLLGTGGLTKSGAGYLSLTSTNDFTGNVLVSGGTLAFGSSVDASDRYLGAIPASYNQNAITLASGTTLRALASIITLNNRGVNLGGGTVNFAADGPAIFFIPTVIDGPGATVVKVGSAEVGFYGATNTFAKLVIGEGNLRIGTGTFPGYDTSYGAVPASLIPDAITISNNATNRIVGSTAVTIHTNRGITFGPGGGVIRNDVSPVAVTINSPTTGPGGFRKEGAQAMTLNGSLGHLGNTILNAGTTTHNGLNTSPGNLIINGNARFIMNHVNANASYTINYGRIDANTNFCMGGGTLNLSPTGAVAVLLAQSTTLGTGPSVTNVILTNAIVLGGTNGVIDISANSGRELVLNGKISGSRDILRNNGGSSGTIVFGNSSNDFTGILTNNSGTIIAAANNALGSAAGLTIISNGSSLAFRGGITYATPEPVLVGGWGRVGNGAISNDSGNNSFSGPLTLYTNTAMGGAPGTVLTLQGVIGETGGAQALNKVSAGTLVLAGANTYSGGTVISNGTLVAANLTGSATGPGNVIIHPPGVLGGNGFVTGNVTVNGTIAPGASPGTLTTGNETWAGGGTYRWEINNATGTQGADPGWDFLSVTGSLTITATAGSPFTIDITSLTTGNVPGNAANFNSLVDQTWTIATATGGIIGFNAAAFNVVATNFQNALAPGGSFLIFQSGNDLRIRYARAPLITTQPVGLTNLCATSFQLSVAASGAPTLSYLWRKGGVILSDGGALAGTSTPVLTVNPATAADSGSYDVIVGNASGVVTSAVAVVVVGDSLPPTFTCPANFTLRANPCTATLTNLTGLLNAADNCTTNPTVLQTPAPGTVLTAGTHVVTFTLTDAAGNSTNCTTLVSVLETNKPVLVCPANITVAVASTNGSSASFTASAVDDCGFVTTTCVPPSGSTFPIGTNAVTCTATDGSGNSTNCTFYVNVCLSSSTNKTVNQVIPDNNGSGLASTLTVASPIGIVTDLNVRLKITNGWNGDLYCYLTHASGFSVLLNRVGRRAGAPLGYGDAGFDVLLDEEAGAGDIHNYRAVLFGGVQTTPLAGSLTNTWRPDGRNVSPTNVLDADARTALLASFNGVNPNGDWTLFVADLEPGDQSTLVSWGIEFCGIPPIPASIGTQTPSQVVECSSNLTLAVTTPSTGPLTNQWSKGGVAISGATNLTLALGSASPAVAGTYRFVLCNMSGCATSAPIVIGVADTLPPVISTCASNTVACPNAAGQYTMPSVLAQVTAVDGCSAITLAQSPAAGSVLPSGTHTVTLSATDASNRTATCTATLVVLTNTTATALTPVTLCPGGTASFATVPSGSGPFSFQWFNKGTLVPGATNGSLSLPAVVNADAGNICVVVSGACSSVTNCTSLTVFTNTVATSLLSVTNACPGDPVIFSALASGTGPRTFQWSKNGTNIAQATNSFYSIPAVALADAGSYCVVVAGFCNSVTNCATLTVSQPPTITAQPVSQTGLRCSNTTFSVSASTASVVPDLAYQWYSNSLAIPGATAATLNLSNLVSSQNGAAYRVVISNCASAVTSAVATLTVLDPAPVIVACYPSQTVGLTNSCTFTLPDLRSQVTALDNCPSLTVSQTPAAGTVLAAGSQVITFVATDNAGLSATCLATVVVRDAAPPTLTCPGNLTLQCTGAATRVTYTVTASDLCTPSVTPLCVPPSGSAFPPGNTVVSCVATDGSGNSNTCTFTVSAAPYTTNFTVNQVIPDNSALGLASTRQVATSVGVVSDLNVRLQLSGGYNGDLYAYLVHESGFSILLNRVGRRAGDASGYGDSGFNLILDDQGTNDVHTYRLALSGSQTNPLGGPLTGTWQPDGRLVDPALVADTDARTALLSTFNGTNPNGEWTLFVADLGPLDTATLVSWGLEICGTPAVPPSITQPPQNLTVDCSSNATFSVTAAGTAPFTNQWYRNGVAIAGATGSTLTLNAVSVLNAGSYRVVVSGLGGSVTSAPASLVVQDAPPTLVCPAGLTAEAVSAAGANVTFTVGVLDVCSPNLTPVCVPPSGSLFPLGPTLVNCTGTDVASNLSSCSFTLRVVDTTPPRACAYNPAVLAAGGTNDNFAGPSPASPSSNLLARLAGYDLQGFDEDVTDAWFAHTFNTLSPFASEVRLRIRLRAVAQFSENDSIILGQGGPGGGGTSLGWSRRLGTSGADPGLAGVTWSPGTTNEFVLNLGALPNLSGPPTDLRPLIRQLGYLDIMVQDDTAVDYVILEVLSCTGNGQVTVTAGPGQCSATATFATPAFTDTVDATLTPSCSPPSGGEFALGTTLVTCTATDDSGNVGYAFFNVVVTESAPVLNLARQGTNVVLCWPRTCAQYVLEDKTTSLGVPGNWSPVGSNAVVVGSQYCVTVPFQGSFRAFRLRRL